MGSNLFCHFLPIRICLICLFHFPGTIFLFIPSSRGASHIQYLLFFFPVEILKYLPVLWRYLPTVSLPATQIKQYHLIYIYCLDRQDTCALQLVCHIFFSFEESRTRGFLQQNPFTKSALLKYSDTDFMLTQ